MSAALRQMPGQPPAIRRLPLLLDWVWTIFQNRLLSVAGEKQMLAAKSQSVHVIVKDFPARPQAIRRVLPLFWRVIARLDRPHCIRI